jgi:hypothetical protein
MSEATFATGRCLCGAVTFEITGEPVRMAACHCKDCQRASGTGHMPLAFFQETDVSIEGEPSSFDAIADSGNVNTRYFCPQCGSRLFSRNSGRPGVIGIAVGCADDNAWFAPQAVVYAKRCEAWDDIPLDIPKFDAMPPPPR